MASGLSENRGQVFTKEQIYDAVCGYDAEGDSFTIAVHIKNIRAKLAVYKLAPFPLYGGRIQMGLRNKKYQTKNIFCSVFTSSFCGLPVNCIDYVGLFFTSLKTGFIISVGDVEANIESKN